MNKTTVIYHSADYDGIFCREIAKKFMPDAEIIGWDFSDGPLAIPDSQIYVLDLPVDRVFGWKYTVSDVKKNPPQLFDRAKMVWIDHHKSSIETHPERIPGYRIDGVAACRLAWQWFTAWDKFKSQTSLDPDEPWFNAHYPFPAKADYVDRKVYEPLAIRLAGEFDIWDKRDPNAELFQHGLRSRELHEDMWDILLSGPTPEEDGKQGLAEIMVDALLEAGEAVQYAKTHENESIIKHAGFDVEFEGLKFLACNHARFNSFLFTAGMKPEHDALLGFCWAGKQWKVSLYHATGKEHHDLSKIAVKYGGGGHRGACGFTCETLPFEL